MPNRVMVYDISFLKANKKTLAALGILFITPFALGKLISPRLMFITALVVSLSVMISQRGIYNLNLYRVSSKAQEYNVAGPEEIESPINGEKCLAYSYSIEEAVPILKVRSNISRDKGKSGFIELNKGQQKIDLNISELEWLGDWEYEDDYSFEKEPESLKEFISENKNLREKEAEITWINIASFPLNSKRAFKEKTLSKDDKILYWSDQGLEKIVKENGNWRTQRLKNGLIQTIGGSILTVYFYILYLAAFTGITIFGAPIA